MRLSEKTWRTFGKFKNVLQGGITDLLLKIISQACMLGSGFSVMPAAPVLRRI